MTTIDSVVNYVLHTPFNTNKNILVERLNQLIADNGGSGGVTSWNDLTDKPFGETTTVKEVLAECQPEYVPEIEEGLSGFVVYATRPDTVVLGETYIVNYNGVDYPCVATGKATREVVDPADSVVILGNLGAATGGTDTGEPFAISWGVSQMFIVPLDGSTTLTISIRQEVTEVQKIDEKYLPEHLQFGEVETVVNEPLNITWDGNTEGLVSVENFYKVSDLVLTDEQIKSAALTDGINAPLTFADNWDGAVASGFATEDIVAHFPTFLVVFVRKDGAELNGFTFPACGIYIAKQDGGFISSLTTTEPVEHTKTVVKPLDEKYLPDSVKGGGTASAVPDDEMLELLMDMDIVQPLSNTNNAVYIDGNNKLYVL